MQEKLTAEKRTAVEALEARIRALEGNLGTEKQDLAAQLRDAERLLEECARPRTPAPHDFRRTALSVTVAPTAVSCRQRPLVEKGERVEAFLGEREREMQELKAQVCTD